MLNILGIGAAYPSANIDNRFLEGLPGRSPGSLPSEGVSSLTGQRALGCGIVARKSTLSLDYITETGNRNPFVAPSHARETPTDLAVRAAQEALERAGIAAQDLGLIIAETSTPLQTTPSEAQRIGNRFGLKIPAYDISCSGAALALHLETLAGWREEVMPRFVLCVSTNTPTQSVDYLARNEAKFSGRERYIYGDGASALVVSSVVPGKMHVREALYASDASKADEYRIDVYGYISISAGVAARLAELMDEMLGQAIRNNKLDPRKLKFIGSQLDIEMLTRICEKHDIGTENHWHNLDSKGDCLGSSAAGVLAEKWDELKKNDTVVISLAGMGLGYGYVVLQG